MLNRVCLLLIFFTFNVVAKKKLVIHTCIKSNGTTAYQEEPCEGKYKKRKIKSKHHGPSKKPKILNSISPFRKIPKINYKDNSTKIILNSAKGFDFSFKVLNKWQVTNKVFNNKLLHMKFLDFTPNAKMSLMMDFIHSEGKSFSLSELHELIYLIGSRYVEGSNEKGVVIDELNIKNGKGVMTTFTNSYMSPRFKYSTRGIIFKNEWLIHFTLLSDSQHSQAFSFALGSLKNNIYIQ